MSTDIDPMVALVESWDTFLVPSTLHEGDRRAQLPTWTPTSSQPRSFLSDARPPLSLLANSDSSNTRSSVPLCDGAPSLLWLLTLVSCNVELLRAAAHLFLQFNAQFASLVDANTAAVNALRERHQQQIASLLEVANSHTTTNMIVDSTVTERVVHQQENELDSLERECATAERQLELHLQETLYAFLSTSAPDAVAAANRMDDAPSWVTDQPTSPSGSSNRGGGDGLYRAEVDVSRFAEVRKAAPHRSPHHGLSSELPFSPLRLVAVRTLKLSNEVGNATTVTAANSPSRRSGKDVALQPIILDVSPLSGLTRCLTSCSGTQDGAVASSVSSAAEEHLLRLAHTRHSVLLLIGTESAALEIVSACKSPELLLGPPHTSREGFHPLPHHPVLRVLFTTRLWGANVVLLWNPTLEVAAAAGGAPVTSVVVEDALELAYAWDADMFSVAVLEGARLPAPSTAPTAGIASSFSSSPAAAFFSGQAMSMEVLRQLRSGVTRELLETAGLRRARCWQGSTAWLQFGGGAAMTADTHMCPRAVGVLYASQQRAAAAAAAAAAAVAAGSPSATLASLTASFKGPPVTFNTPLAIRAFLPLPEEYFVKERPRDGPAVSGVAEGGSDGGDAGPVPVGSNSSGGYVHSSQAGASRRFGTGALDVEKSPSDDADFSAGSFPSLPSLQGSLRGGFGGVAAGSAGGGGGGGRERSVPYGIASPHRNARQREAMGLEALVRYAFGEFAEVL